MSEVLLIVLLLWLSCMSIGLAVVVRDTLQDIRSFMGMFNVVTPDVLEAPEEHVEDTEEVKENPIDTPTSRMGPSEFDLRILQYQEELNSVTYEKNVAQTYHPDVHNLPHSVITDTPIKYEEEVAE